MDHVADGVRKLTHEPAFPIRDFAGYGEVVDTQALKNSSSPSHFHIEMSHKAFLLHCEVGMSVLEGVGLRERMKTRETPPGAWP